MITICTLIFVIAICFYQSITYKRMYRYVTNRLDESMPYYCPLAAVVMPCKGLDPDFENNLHKLVAQDYGSKDSNLQAPNFEIIFSVASSDDPAYPIIEKVINQYPSIKSKLVVAGIDNKRAQKITNQLEALKQISPQAEVLVFVDSDVIARKDFLTRLITPLQDSRIGITTGYRFYLPSKFSLPGLIRSLWNRLSAWELSSEKFAFAWGGAMAIRKNTFNRAGVTEVWDRSADDDLAMTTAVKKLGLSVSFVPQCLVVSDGDASWSEVIEWTNRQLILTKVYYPALWLMAVIRAGVMAGWLIVVLALTFQIFALQVYTSLPVLLAASLLLLVELFFLFQAHGLWHKLLTQEANTGGPEQVDFEKAYKKLLWQSALILPLAHVVLPLLTLYSLLTNRIRWRGINYELRSPHETVVV
jgi:ceramide glucosyltransferase